MGLSLHMTVPAATVFLQGILSFFSPCVLPLLPLYIGYLSGGADRAEDGTAAHRRGRTMLNTLFFVLGVSFAFFLLGMGMSAIGRFFGSHRLLFARVGGVIVILFGLYQLGMFGQSAALNTERRLPLRLERMAMSPLTALLMGFVFSFAWTPCVGPALSGVLLMAASADSASAGFLLIGVYTLGFVIPFLAVGLFTTTLLGFFREHRGVVRWTVKLGGILMLLMGVMMITGAMNNVSGYLSRAASADTETAEDASPAKTDFAADEEDAPAAEETAPPEPRETASADEAEAEKYPAYDFTLCDQYGNLHSLADYEGKVIFLNFWATWCPPCRAEMPDIEKLYEKYVVENETDVVILGVAFPGNGGETDADGIADFLEENGYYYPVLMDTEGQLMYDYYITAFPTTFMIDREGNIFGYVTGSMTEEIMESIIEQTLEGRLSEG